MKEVALDDLPSEDERGPSSIRQTLGTVSKPTLRKLLRDWVERMIKWGFFGLFFERIDTILN